MWRTARGFLKAVRLTLAILTALALGFVAEENLRGQWALRRVLDRLRAQHEPLTLAELSLPDFSRGRDAGAAAVAAGQALQKLAKANPIASKGPTGMMGWAAPGRAIARHRDPTFPALEGRYQTSQGGQTPVYEWAALERELANAAPTLDRLREALRQPDAAPAVDYGKGLDASPPALSWNTFMWLGSAGIDALHARNLNAANDNLVALADLATYQRRDFRLIAQGTTNVVDMFTLALVWEALQEDGWTDAQLTRLQAALAREQPLEDALRCLEVERTRVPTEYAQIRQSQTARLVSYRIEGRNIVNDLVSDEDIPGPSEPVIWLRSVLWRAAWSEQDEARAMALWEDLLTSARELRHEKSWTAFNARTPKSEKPLVQLALWRKSFSETLGPQSARALLQHAMRAETGRQMMLAAVALKRYTLRTGAAPASLETLVPAFLPSVPTDYMDGKPLRYRPLDGQHFVLYSVGIDGRDDGGNSEPSGESKQRGLWTSRDAVWPSEVTPPPAKSP